MAQTYDTTPARFVVSRSGSGRVAIFNVLVRPGCPQTASNADHIYAGGQFLQFVEEGPQALQLTDAWQVFGGNSPSRWMGTWTMCELSGKLVFSSSIIRTYPPAYHSLLWSRPPPLPTQQCYEETGLLGHVMTRQGLF